jgi:hypothetical protein
MVVDVPELQGRCRLWRRWRSWSPNPVRSRAAWSVLDVAAVRACSEEILVTEPGRADQRGNPDALIPYTGLVVIRTE